MQIFEVLELKEFPYMTTKEVHEGNTVKDVLNSHNEENVFLLVDHDLNRIWTWNGSKSSFKLQIYGGILARKLRQQLRLFYRVYSLNIFSIEDPKYQEILDKDLGGGKAQPVGAEEFVKSRYDTNVRLDIIVSTDINVKKAFDFIDEVPKPEGFERKFFIVGGNIFTEEENVESFIKEEKIVKKPLKLGILNNGFTFFYDDLYSTRLIINERKIQGLELYTKKTEKSKAQVLNLKIPIFQEEKFSKKGEMKSLIDAFEIPSELPETKEE
ncbi:MAG: hypothetical protein EU539_02110 [Promethearchaeota archaeon]|nr:MAG: hypothetical protein EU539_02110 [Candidatus Lokiarchaeota archaeon]